MYNPGTWIDKKKEVRTRRLITDDPEKHPDCCKDHKWGEDSEHDKLFNEAKSKIAKDKALIFKRH